MQQLPWRKVSRFTPTPKILEHLASKGKKVQGSHTAGHTLLRSQTVHLKVAKYSAHIPALDDGSRKLQMMQSLACFACGTTRALTLVCMHCLCRTSCTCVLWLFPKEPKKVLKEVRSNLALAVRRPDTAVASVRSLVWCTFVTLGSAACPCTSLRTRLAAHFSTCRRSPEPGMGGGTVSYA